MTRVRRSNRGSLTRGFLISTSEFLILSKASKSSISVMILLLKRSLGWKSALGWFWAGFLNKSVPYLDIGFQCFEQGFQIVDFSYDLVMKMQFGMQIAFGVVLGGGSLTRSPKPGCDIWRPIWQPNSLIFIYFLNKNIEFIYQPKVSKISPPT